MTPNRSTASLLTLLLLATFASACVGDDAETTAPAAEENNLGGKTDSGWLGADTFEVNAVIRATVMQEATGDWTDLETDADVQAKLVDEQIKFIKNTAEARGWRLNQLAGDVTVVSAEANADGEIEIAYEATVDLLGRLRGDVPKLDDLETTFKATVPATPADFTSSQVQACSKADDGHSAAAYNFHYYFAPDQLDCDMSLVQAEVEITEVFERPTAYPEYDRLMQDFGDGTVGFTAALVPNTGDSDPLSRFKVHAAMLEDELGLEGEDAADNTFRRYIYAKDGVKMVIDLYDPTQIPWTTGFGASFREKLSVYTLVHYNGHSSYGTKHLLDEPESFSDFYQIFMIHSCQSYAYYTRQIFRAKETAEDPSGFDLADIIATGKSSYPSGAPPTLRTLLSSLMEGMVAIDRGRPEQAPDWLTISERISDSTWGDIQYGVAGARTNVWQPTP